MLFREKYNAKEYEKSRERELAEFVLYHSFEYYLGNIIGVEALDHGCGEGTSSRILKKLGAARVVGIDINNELIEIAKEKEKKFNQGIEYHIGDVSEVNLSKFGIFDLVTTVLVLHYSSSKKILNEKLLRIYNALKTNGGVIGMISNPNIPLNYDSYGVCYAHKGETEGSIVNVKISNFKGKKLTEFPMYYWSQETYEKAFQSAGFYFRWLPAKISDKGIKKYSENFWKDFRENPIYSIFCLKKK